MTHERRGAGRLRTFFRTMRLLETDEIESARVAVRFPDTGEVYTTLTDGDGRFTIGVDGLARPQKPGPRAFEVRVTAADAELPPPVTGTVYVLDAARPIVVSDFDDTLVHSHVNDRSRSVRTATTKNASQREVVAGAPLAFLRAMAAGAGGFVYLSGSPENLQPRILDFLRLHRFPRGAVLLKNVGVGPDADEFPHSVEYKGARLERLARRLPTARFVLVGDTGESDPEIYRTFARRWPGRVAGIILRRVPGSDTAPERFAGATVIDTFESATSVLADRVRAAP